MKKKLVFVMVFTMIAVLLFSGLASAGGVKVDVCHINEANFVMPWPPGNPTAGSLYFGKEISVSENAYETHAAHGDLDSLADFFFGGDVASGPIAAFRAAGGKLPAADCYIFVLNN